jgi:molybdenum cofactor cytidylyltransferase
MNRVFNKRIYAVVLAAGRSERMGQPKMDLPWSNTTILGHILSIIEQCFIGGVKVVYSLNRTPKAKFQFEKNGIEWIVNPIAEKGEMLSSIKVGLASLPEECQFAMVFLGDQPTIELKVILEMVKAIHSSEKRLVFPSYKFRRGHPWIVHKYYWNEIQQLSDEQSVRTFINAHAEEISYVNFDMDAPEDLDTPQIYEEIKKRKKM